MPHGTIAAKSRRSVDTFNAKPWEVIQREMCTPIAPSFPAFVQVPIRPSARLLSIALVRTLRGHYSPEHHEGMEVPGIYWHFVDIMWIIVYTTVYVL